MQNSVAAWCCGAPQQAETRAARAQVPNEGCLSSSFSLFPFPPHLFYLFQPFTCLPIHSQDNYKFMSEDEEKKRRKKQRKLNRQMNRLRIKKDQREEWLQQHCLEDPTSAVQKVDGEKEIVVEGRDAGERKNEQKNVLVDELVDDFKKVQIDFKGGDDWKTTNTSDATKDQAISLTFSTNS